MPGGQYRSISGWGLWEIDMMGFSSEGLTDTWGVAWWH